MQKALILGYSLMMAAFAADAPEASISNGIIEARLYLPDAQNGYYRGTRFDWSGVIYSLRYQGHEYFGTWFERYDPKTHDAITGPVEEFLTRDAGLGYAEAKPGGSFIRIGVGVVKKPDEPAYRRFNTYEISDPGKWTVRTAADSVEFTHALSSDTGYGYVYKKEVRLAKDKPMLTLQHSLRNTGKRAIGTSVYDHNFFVIDGRPTGPDSVVRFPFEPRATRDLKGLAEVRDGQLRYLQELQKGQSVFTEVEGFGGTERDYDIRLENRSAGAGVRITGDRPIAKLVYWSIRTTFCPEPYIDLRIEPGSEATWIINYEFYSLKKDTR
ncbi:MAG TPA: hypothetical protein VL285_22655 [Bryobacteraceae bacterium]|jgi:hypothetical protein|nr:hypothetical protein [Bryobacteraceae bacterium]